MITTIGPFVDRVGRSVDRSVDRFDELLGRSVSVRSISLVRALVGAVAVLHLTPLAFAAVGDVGHADTFRHPYVPWVTDVGSVGDAMILSAGVLASAAMSVGFLTRWSVAATTAVVGFHLLQSTTHVHNNRAYLFAVLVVLAVAPCGRAFSIDAWRADRAGAPLHPTMTAWPLWLLRFECAAVYGASGLGKLVDPDWFGGTVTWGRVVAQEALVRTSVLPDLIADVLLDRSFHTVAAKFIVGTELFIAIGLWRHRTRRWALAAAIMFHVMIEFSADVQIFSYLGIAVLVVWSSPDLDWVERFTRRSRPTAPTAVVSP